MKQMFALTGFHIENGLFSSKDHFHCLLYDGEDPFGNSSYKGASKLSLIAEETLKNSSFDPESCALFATGKRTANKGLFGREVAGGDIYSLKEQIRSQKEIKEALLIHMDEELSCGIFIKHHKALKDSDRIYAWIDFEGSDDEILPGLFITDNKGPGKKSEKFFAEKNEKCPIYNLNDSGSILPYIITGAVCLYNRFLPANTLNKEIKCTDLFLKLYRSMTWFGSDRKVLIEYDDIFLSMKGAGKETDLRGNKYLAYSTPFIIPLTGNSVDEVLEETSSFEKELSKSSDLKTIAKEWYERSKGRKGFFTAVVTADDKEGLKAETDFLKAGIFNSLEMKEDFITPKGSFFTPDPLGKEGKTAFVYPGVGSLYPDLSRDIFQIFPEIYSALSMVVNPSEVVRADEIYPKDMGEDPQKTIAEYEKILKKDIKSLSKSGIAFSYLYTMAAMSLGIIPDAALGYSMGEVAMFTSLGMWSDPGVMAERLNRSDIFGDRLSGRMEAVREYFKESSDNKNIWGQYTVLAPADEIKELIEDEEKVFLILINTDNESVIAGDPLSCETFIEKHRFTYFPLNIPLCIHCPPAYLEYDKIAELFTLETGKSQGNLKIYSASCYLEVPKREKAVAHSIAKTFCERVDFPRLVRKTHSDGVRIFIETGPRKICSQWIDEILKGERYVTIPMNVKGIEDNKTLVKAVAKLVSHGVDLDLTRFYRAY